MIAERSWRVGSRFPRRRSPQAFAKTAGRYPTQPSRPTHLTLAIVMGEFTIASLAAFKTFPTYIQIVNESQPYEAAALSLLSFMIVWAAMIALVLVGRGRPRPTQLAATR